MQFVQIYTADLLKNQDRRPNFVVPYEHYGQNWDQKDMKAYWPSKAQFKIISQKQTFLASLCITLERDKQNSFSFFKKKLVTNAQHY